MGQRDDVPRGGEGRLDAMGEYWRLLGRLQDLVGSGRLSPGVEVLPPGPAGMRSVLARRRPRVVRSMFPTCTLTTVQTAPVFHRSMERVGVRGVALLHPDGLEADALRYLAESRPRTQCRLGARLVPAKLCDRDAVVVEGPRLAGRPTSLLVRDPTMVLAVHRVWLRAVRESVSLERARATDPLARLTARQRGILRLLGEELPDAAIARRLGISLRTVRYDISVVMRLLRVRSRFGLGMAMGHLTAHGGPPADLQHAANPTAEVPRPR